MGQFAKELLSSLLDNIRLESLLNKFLLNPYQRLVIHRLNLNFVKNRLSAIIVALAQLFVDWNVVAQSLHKRHSSAICHFFGGVIQQLLEEIVLLQFSHRLPHEVNRQVVESFWRQCF